MNAGSQYLPSLPKRLADRSLPSDTRSRSQVAYDALRSAIVHGVIRPNQRLIEAELAEEFKISRTPVRESLQRLAADGLIVPARRGWVVREHSLDEIRQIYEVRAALEGYATRLAAERATDDQLASIQEILEERDSLAEGEGRIAQLVDANDRFHSAIVEAAGNMRLLQQIKQNREYYFNQQLARLYVDREISTSGDQHHQLMDALMRRDGEAAEAMARSHVYEALQIIIARFG